MSDIKINYICRKCLLCGNSIKKFAKWDDNINRQVHRRCWLKFRSFEDRYADVLFCGDRKNTKKCLVIKPY
jgi:hypothetical protein